MTRCSLYISLLLSVCHHADSSIQTKGGHLQIQQRNGTKAVRELLSSVAAYNYHVETSATFLSHATIQCVLKLPGRKNIYSGLVVVIKTVMRGFFIFILEALYLQLGVPGDITKVCQHRQ